MTAPVDAHPGGASPYGIYEMVGNVEEWCADWYDAYPGAAYRGKAFGKTFKVLRGGNSFFTQNHARCAYRCFTRPEDSGIDGVVGAGFRCVIDPK
jgi:gamma-glutamyl hercynylcysteine S-oxide synthase